MYRYRSARVAIVAVLLTSFANASLARGRSAARRRKVGHTVTLGGNQFRIWGSVSTGVMPKAVSISPDGRTLVVTNFGRRKGHNLTIIDTRIFSRRRTVSYPGNGIESAFSPDGKLLFTTNYYGSKLHFVDTRTWTIRHTLRPGSFPKMLAPSPDGRMLYVANWSSGTVAAVSVDPPRRRWVVRTGRHPRGLSVSPDGKLLYVANAGGRSVAVVDTQSRRVVTQIPTSRYPRHTALTRDGSRLYVSTMTRSYLQVIDTAKRRAIRKIQVAVGPRSIALSRDERFVYVANYAGHALTIVDTRTYQVRVLPLDIEKGSGVTVHPSDRMIYVTGWCSDDLWAVERIKPGQTPIPLGRAARRRRPVRRDPATAHALGCGTRRQLEQRRQRKARE